MDDFDVQTQPQADVPADTRFGRVRTLTIHLGVIVQPYEKYSRGQTTADVAEILEDKYGVMDAFWNVHGDDVAKDMERDVGKSIENMMAGSGIPRAPFAGAMSKTQRRFKEFLSSREVERVGIPGVPTQAALNGVNHRRKHPYAKANPRRPSFIDTGLYQASFVSWVD